MKIVKKTFLDPADLFHDAFRLANRIWKSGFRPDVILVMWRGGTPVGIVVHEYFLFHGVPTIHAVVKAESYTGIGRRRTPVIENMGPILRKIPPHARVLLVDDIYDSGQTIARVRAMLRKKTKQIRAATLYCKATAPRRPDYFLRLTTNWIVFPHELAGLTPAEIRKKSPLLPTLVLSRRKA